MSTVLCHIESKSLLVQDSCHKLVELVEYTEFGVAPTYLGLLYCEISYLNM